LHSSNRGVLQYFLEAKHHQQLAYIGYQAVNFVCKLQQHFSVDNTGIQKVQWNSSLAYYKLYNQAMLRSLQDFTTLHSHTGLMSFLLQYGLQNYVKTNTLYHFKTADMIQIQPRIIQPTQAL